MDPQPRGAARKRSIVAAVREGLLDAAVAVVCVALVALLCFRLL